MSSERTHVSPHPPRRRARQGGHRRSRPSRKRGRTAEGRQARRWPAGGRPDTFLAARRRSLPAARLPPSRMLRALDLANLPDAGVVALALEGREAAHRELLKRTEQPVFPLVFPMVRDRELAEDLTQAPFVKVLSH